MGAKVDWGSEGKDRNQIQGQIQESDQGTRQELDLEAGDWNEIRGRSTEVTV